MMVTMQLQFSTERKEKAPESMESTFFPWKSDAAISVLFLDNDGKLSFEEFKNYFSDGILSSEELWELFSGIDRRHSDNVDTEKLCDYFSAYLGEYRNVLSALETLNAAVLAAMDKTKLVRMAQGRAAGWETGAAVSSAAS
ncbi:hypothetical protein EK904_003305 [Melospiza melodia maxima]|nr:hypothetical protein EK904_003305 [Melospiza melodia maxima]